MQSAQLIQKSNAYQTGFRPTPAKGMLLSGSFLPSEGGASITRAPHLQRDFTTVTVRFVELQDQRRSVCGIRFHLGEHVHTDILAYSVNVPHAGAKPMPRTSAWELFLGRSVYQFTNTEGRLQFGRYCIRFCGPGFSLHAVPASGGPGRFQFGQIRREVAAGSVKLQILVQIGTENNTLEERPLVDFGSLYLTEIRSLAVEEQRRISFDPIPRVDGIAHSN